MSKKTSIPPKIILGDRGIQTYRSCDKGFTDSMRLVPFKQVKDGTGDARIVRESEFAKPYGEQYEDPHEDFWAMEYEAPSLPPWGWDYPGMEDPASTYHVTFLCGGDYCYCPEGTKTFDGECGWEIIGAEFVPPWGAVGVSFSKTQLKFTGLSTASGCGYLTITMKARFKSGDKYQTVIGTHSNIQVCQCDDDECEEACVVTVPVAYDDANSDDTIVQSNTATVAVTGDGAPFSWSVSGTGFTLDYSETAGLENTLNASGSACGTATITITDCDGNIATGYVTCTTGVWTQDWLFTSPITPAYYGPSCTGYCGQGGTGGHYYFTLRHRIDRGTVNYYCCDNGADWQFLYTFDDGYQVSHAEALFLGTGTCTFYGCSVLSGASTNVAGTPGGEVWVCV